MIKKVKRNRMGFSLVELIIVIAIMAVMIGVLAPQFLKFTTNARVSTDVTNAQRMADAVNVAIAEKNGASVPAVIQGAGGTAVSNVPGLTVLPECKVNKAYVWKIESSVGEGVEQITLNGVVIYAKDGTSSAYFDLHHVD